MKQSVYLSDTEHARWKALGVTLGDVIRAGLTTLEAAKEKSAAMRIELADPQGQLLEEIADPAMKRRDVALTYGLALRGDVDRVDWPKVNKAIIERWSVAALRWIKDFAWKGPSNENG
jgi:hypothetical protein